MRQVSAQCASGDASEDCAAALDRACAAGVEETCKAAKVLRASAVLKKCTAESIPDDASAECTAAAARYDATCGQGDKDACSYAAAIRVGRMRRTTKKCDEHGVADCKADCDAGDLDACVEVGSMYLQGHRVPRDVVKGGAILEMSCKMGSPRACFMHGSQLQVTDPGPAAQSLARACDADERPWSELSCNMLLGMLDRGSYAPPPAERRDLLKRLCDKERAEGGDKSACGRLED